MKTTYYPPEIKIVRPRGFARALFKIAQETVKERNALREKVMHDSLTGLLSRGAFMERYEAMLSAALRHGRNLTMAMIDIDHFKKINDTYGHPIGDWVLQEVAKTIKNSLRSSDVTGRYGGEEFMVLLEETPFDKAKIPLERIREKVEGLSLQNKIKVTVSVGYASYLPHEVPHILSSKEQTRLRQELIERADEALYQAKKSGRNRICGSPPSDEMGK